MAAYPPYQQPLLDRQTGLVTKPWQLFFLSLAGGGGATAATIADGSVPLDAARSRSTRRGCSGAARRASGRSRSCSIGAGLDADGPDAAA